MVDAARSESSNAPDIILKSGAYTLRVTGDSMRILLDCAVVPPDIRSLIVAVRADLSEKGVPEEWLGEPLEQRLRPFASAPSISGAVIVEGEPSVPPTDGRIEWGGDFFAVGFAIDEKTGAIDYRRPIAQTSVEEGQFLARIIPPNPGKNGRDVFGRMLPAAKGTWPAFRAGQNVREDRDDRCYYATKSGRIRWDASILSVDEVYTIRGNVGLETGNISHSGALIVEGDIEACTEVEARGDIEVYGVIERADVSTRGNLYVRGGITGRGKRPIQVAGRVQARFINEAELEVDGDMAIEREILQSTVRTRGILAMPQGRVVGGEIMALGGILIGQSGSEAGVPTLLTAGEDFRLLRRLPELQEEINALETRRERVKQVLEPLRGRKMTPEMHGAMEKLLLDLSLAEERITEIKAEIEQLKQDAKERARRRIEVDKNVFPETIFNIGGDRKRIREAILGPLYALPVRGEIQLRTGRLKWDLKRRGTTDAQRQQEELEENPPEDKA